MARQTQTYKDICELLENNEVSGLNGVTPRDSDKVLIVQWLQLKVGLELTAEQVKKLYAASSFESITRARRKLQNSGQYLGSPEVMRRRRIKGYELEQTAPTESSAGIQRRIEEN